MKRFSGLFVFGLVVVSLLVACGGDGAETAVSNETETSANTITALRLTDDYDDALSVQSQLAVGTLQLEETDLAVDAVLAGEILPLWQALQSLSNSGTAAAAELTAVLNQIQSTMKPEQISAIAEMQLTQESMAALIEDGTLALGRGGLGGDAAGGDGEFAPPPGGFGGGPGGGQGGGIPGGGLGGGRGDLSEDDLATRQAARESGDFGGFQNRALTGAVIRLLAEKTGVESEQPADPFAVMWDVLTEATGLTVEEIQTQTAEGTTLIELIQANGGDVEAVKADLIASLEDSPLAQRDGLDLEQYVMDMLTGMAANNQ